MSIKKLLILSAASLTVVASAAAFAGGPDAMSGPMPAAPAPAMADWTGWYAGLNMGGAIGNAPSSTTEVYSGALTAGKVAAMNAFNASNILTLSPELIALLPDNVRDWKLEHTLLWLEEIYSGAADLPMYCYIVY